VDDERRFSAGVRFAHLPEGPREIARVDLVGETPDWLNPIELFVHGGESLRGRSCSTSSMPSRVHAGPSRTSRICSRTASS